MPSSPIEKQITKEWNSGEGRNTSRFTSDENTAKSFSIDVLQFPDYLGTKELNQYVLFNINVRGKSKLKMGNEKKIAVVKRDNSAQLSESQLQNAKVASEAVVGAVGGAAAASGLSKLFGNAANQKQALTGLEKSKQAAVGAAVKAGGAILGGAAAIGIGATELLEADTSYRISDAIALYINDAPSVKYSAQYDNKDLGTLAGLVGGKSATDSIGGFASEAGGALLTAFAKLPQSAGVGAPADIIGASSKVGLNPFKEVLFQSVDFRSFQFKYRFLPKSQKEAEQVKAIIDRFKFHMHPELSTNKLFFIYPSEFEISYIFEGKENQYFHKFKPCVLESMDVSYGGDQYSSFTDGKPTEVVLSMLFRETEILTKAQILKGY